MLRALSQAQRDEPHGTESILGTESNLLTGTPPHEKAREIARNNLKMYIGLPNYQNNLLQFGFTPEDFENGGSDALVDALVIWGEPDKIAAHMQEHLDAGANQVCIQAFRADGGLGPDEALLQDLARILN